MERCTSASDAADERGNPNPGVGTKCVRDENDAENGEVEPIDFEALKQNPVVDCAAFKELHRTEEFKNLLDFLDAIEIDDDGNSFSYVNSSHSE